MAAGRRGKVTAKTTDEEKATEYYFDDDNEKKKNLGKINHSCTAKWSTKVVVGSAFVFVVLLFQRHRAVSMQEANNNVYPSSFLRYAKVNDKVPRPYDWQLWGIHRFRREFNCSGYLADQTKPLPDMDYWQIMLDAYNQEVDGTYKFDDIVPPTRGYRLDENGPQPYYAKLSPGKGRGVFASRDIKKGEIVHDGTKSDVVFPDATSFRRFMFALPREMACDASEWIFTQRFEQDGPMRIVSSLNIAILMNEGNNQTEVNVEPENDYSSVLRAMRDIKEGEEILMDYSDYPTDYVAAGLEFYQKSFFELFVIGLGIITQASLTKLGFYR
jgi:hypothetical protein